MAEQKTLLIVDGEALAGWAGVNSDYPDIQNAKNLLKEIKVARLNYERVIDFNGDPNEFDWQTLLPTLAQGMVIIGGIQRSVSVEDVRLKLNELGIKASVDENLSLDSVSLEWENRKNL